MKAERGERGERDKNNNTHSIHRELLDTTLSLSWQYRYIGSYEKETMYNLVTKLTGGAVYQPH